jgi:predicted metalloprotease with PDZ domain
MTSRATTAILAISLLIAQGVVTAGQAENQMGYRLMTQQETDALPRNNGALGMDVERARQIMDDGMTFDVMRVKLVRRGSAGAQAGFKVGDQIIAIDGRVFASVRAFAAYVGSLSPGQEVDIDYMPAGEGPQQAQRLATVIGSPPNARTTAEVTPPTGMSTSKKIAIGAGAVALLGCYEIGCFSHRPGDQAAGQAGTMGQPIRTPTPSTQR